LFVNCTWVGIGANTHPPPSGLDNTNVPKLKRVLVSTFYRRGYTGRRATDVLPKAWVDA